MAKGSVVNQIEAPFSLARSIRLLELLAVGCINHMDEVVVNFNEVDKWFSLKSFLFYFNFRKHTQISASPFHFDYPEKTQLNHLTSLRALNILLLITPDLFCMSSNVLLLML